MLIVYLADFDNRICILRIKCQLVLLKVLIKGRFHYIVIYYPAVKYLTFYDIQTTIFPFTQWLFLSHHREELFLPRHLRFRYLFTWGLSFRIIIHYYILVKGISRLHLRLPPPLHNDSGRIRVPAPKFECSFAIVCQQFLRHAKIRFCTIS